MDPLIELGTCLDELDVEALLGAERVQEAQCTAEHGGAGSVGRKRNVQPAMTVGRLKPEMCEERELSLAFPHRSFGDEQRRAAALSEE
jgi:hypothetical protein